jgi:hexosaminidase
MANTRKVEYMVFPRLAALSEVLWSDKKRDFAEFENRLQQQLKRYDLWKTNYSRAFYNIHASVLPAPDNNGVYWQLSSKLLSEYPQCFIEVTEEFKQDSLVQHNIQIPDWKHDPKGTKGYTKDSVIWSKDSFRRFMYDKPVKLTKNTRLIATVRTHFRLTSDSVRQAFFINKATGKKISLAAPPARNYPGNGGVFGLVNGALSEKGVNSPEWLGWNGGDMEAVIDLGTAQSISSVNCHTMEQKPSWIYRPASVEVLLSADGKQFNPAGKTTDFTVDTLNMYNGIVKIPATSTRYVKVIAKNYGKIPDGEAGASNPAWLFIDEIQVD